MQIKALYQEDKYITVICPDFDPTIAFWQKLQQMLESKKFQPLRDQSAWKRQEFTEIPTESFEFWFSQVTKLCNKYGNEPIEHEEISIGSQMNHQGAFTTYDAIVAQLTQLQEEIATLKKFDSSANEKLRQLREKFEGRG
ncbi:MAG: hypothetical protein HWQ38_19025 [Nostoc sp. NMS7]|uniref:hypothetical protein n=1 Tax=Nostoc sp. NMS7 TaxID=2815391 RepID=UPI0025D694CE|nr:hypothetical protein [Nostoc sp. NMS7]MBN3948430.1 hypothetical protein [Nostoc sp. NMS7]